MFAADVLREIRLSAADNSFKICFDDLNMTEYFFPHTYSNANWVS